MRENGNNLIKSFPLSLFAFSFSFSSFSYKWEAKKIRINDNSTSKIWLHWLGEFVLIPANEFVWIIRLLSLTFILFRQLVRPRWLFKWKVIQWNFIVVFQNEINAKTYGCILIRSKGYSVLVLWWLKTYMIRSIENIIIKSEKHLKTKNGKGSRMKIKRISIHFKLNIDSHNENERECLNFYTIKWSQLENTYAVKVEGNLTLTLIASLVLLRNTTLCHRHHTSTFFWNLEIF